MPNTRPQLGIGSLPQGRDNYRACLYFHTSVNISAEDVHKQGLAEVSRIEKLIKQVNRNSYSNHYANQYAQCIFSNEYNWKLKKMSIIRMFSSCL